MVSLGNFPRLRWGRSTRVELGMDCGDREGELETDMDGLLPDIEEEGYGGDADGSTKSLGNAHSLFIPPAEEKALRSG